MLRGLLVGIGFALAAQGNWADVIYLKDGQKLEGIIEKQRQDPERVFIRTPGGLVPVSRSKIDRIEVRENLTQQEIRGDLALQENDLDRALENYVDALATDPNNEELNRKVAEVRKLIREREEERFKREFEEIDQSIARGDYDRAIEMAAALAAKAEEGPSRDAVGMKIGEAWLAKARDFRNKVNYPRAEEAYRKSIEAAPQGAIANFELAEMIGAYPAREKEAFEYYKKGIQIAQDDPLLIEEKELLRYRNACANLYLKSNNHREAAELFWLVFQHDKDNQYPKAIESILVAYTALLPELAKNPEENQKAIAVLEQVTEARPLDYKARYLLGRIYHDRNDCARAVPYLEGALANMSSFNPPEINDVRFYLGICYNKLDRDDQAIQTLTALLSAQPTRYDAICELGEIYLERLAYDQALRQFDTAIRTESSSYRAYLGAARTYKETKRYADAVRMMEKLIELRSEYPEYQYELGLIFSADNKYSEARSAYNKALELVEKRPEDERAHELKGKIYTQLGVTSLADRNYNQAIEQFDKALEYFPSFAGAYDGKGQAYRELGMLDEAEKFFMKAIESEPNNPNFALNLGTFYHKFRNDKEKALDYYMTYFEKGGADPQVREWIRECGGVPPAIRTASSTSS